MSKTGDQKENGLRRGATLFWRIAGWIFILIGLVILGYAGFQKALVAYHQQQLKKEYIESVAELPEKEEVFEHVVITEWQPMRIVIPKINVDLVVLKGDVFDRDLLDKGPVHFEMSDLPGTEDGNTAIAGHRGSRWGFFTDLDFLEPGDEIYLDIAGYRFTYRVEWIRIVDPYDWSVIAGTDYPAITLQTCEPKNARATHRLIVRGALDVVGRVPED